MSRREWSPEDDATLQRAYCAGVPLLDLCQTFGRTRAAIKSRAAYLHLFRPERARIVSLSTGEIEWARTRLMFGGGLTDIADCLGIESGDLDLILWRRLCRKADRKMAA